MADKKPDVSLVSEFDSSKLKHVVTKEKNTLPNDESEFRANFRNDIFHGISKERGGDREVRIYVVFNKYIIRFIHFK